MAVSFTSALIAGGVAGTAVDVSLFPIDTIKTRLQSQSGFWKSGGFKNLYKGLGAAAVGSAPGAALFFCTYETAKPAVKGVLGDHWTSHSAAASVGEVMACLVRVPTENVKQKMQAGQFTKATDCLGTIMKERGIGGFYAGYMTTVFREIPFSFIQFPIWEGLKAKWAASQGKAEADPWQGAICGSIAGGFSAAVTTPLDVCKTRLMLQRGNATQHGLFGMMKEIVATEGAAKLFSGVGPRTMWIAIGGGVFFGAYEKSIQMMKGKI